MTWNNSAEKGLFKALTMFPLSAAFMCLDHTAGVLADSCAEGSSLSTSVRIANAWSNNLSPDFIHAGDLMASYLQKLRITHDWHNFDMTDIHLPIRQPWNQITVLLWRLASFNLKIPFCFDFRIDFHQSLKTYKAAHLCFEASCLFFSVFCSMHKEERRFTSFYTLEKRCLGSDHRIIPT